MGRSYEIAKRVLDFLAATVGLLGLSWLFVLLYVLVRLTSRGPGFYVQDRAGRGGRLLPRVKFRTMRADHVHDPDPSIVIGDGHSAVTPLGRFLRRSRLDELPQLLNVLTGAMSLVGPRPTVPEQVADYDEFKRRRLLARPGITGLAQINGGTELTWGQRIEWDVYYIRHRSLWLDLKILVRTFAVVLAGTDRRARRLSDMHPDWRAEV
jgi:lipopolysaccharide/colanic/teichoic acid biosynthesis glycosyltransferase